MKFFSQTLETSDQKADARFIIFDTFSCHQPKRYFRSGFQSETNMKIHQSWLYLNTYASDFVVKIQLVC